MNLFVNLIEIYTSLHYLINLIIFFYEKSFTYVLRVAVLSWSDTGEGTEGVAV